MKCSWTGCKKEAVGFKVFNAPRGAVGWVAYKMEARCEKHIDE